jgi:aryl-alcohol dehydrogenase-like predicted oxidoreductase
MQYVKLGRSGCQVSRLCLGTMNFGPHTSEPDAWRIMDRALEAGINFFDTANVYGWNENRGLTESIIGRWLAQGGGRRERIVLATKVYGPMPDDGPNRNAGLSAYKIRREVEESLRRLQTDHIDLYQMHHIDRSAGWEELWGAFEDLVHAGKVVYVGSSNFAAWDIAWAQGAARERHFLGLVSEQHKYSLVTRQPELEVLPCCQALGLAVLPWSPLGGGLLSGKALEAAAGTRAATDWTKAAVQQHGHQLEPFREVCRSIGAAEAEVALAWVLANPVVTSPIIGPRTMEQFEGALRALELKLDDAAMKRLDEIFPGPGGAAPQAYAW